MHSVIIIILCYW